eukprot:TRINITY_DN2824_c2_g1_i1.p2 TRINITY_DN2824_c2_g1~~TRINITY_DN2824_c2_g1_i1.p2  ORF type:complete len:381 (+),score=135.84 TRINITY_DN2824_c2_g1_i1:306-1448(+)
MATALRRSQSCPAVIAGSTSLKWDLEDEDPLAMTCPSDSIHAQVYRYSQPHGGHDVARFEVRRREREPEVVQEVPQREAATGWSQAPPPAPLCLNDVLAMQPSPPLTSPPQSPGGGYSLPAHLCNADTLQVSELRAELARLQQQCREADANLRQLQSPPRDMVSRTAAAASLHSPAARIGAVAPQPLQFGMDGVQQMQSAQCTPGLNPAAMPFTPGQAPTSPPPEALGLGGPAIVPVSPRTQEQKKRRAKDASSPRRTAPTNAHAAPPPAAKWKVKKGQRPALPLPRAGVPVMAGRPHVNDAAAAAAWNDGRRIAVKHTVLQHDGFDGSVAWAQDGSESNDWNVQGTVPTPYSVGVPAGGDSDWSHLAPRRGTTSLPTTA